MFLKSLVNTVVTTVSPIVAPQQNGSNGTAGNGASAAPAPTTPDIAPPPTVSAPLLPSPQPEPAIPAAAPGASGSAPTGEQGQSGGASAAPPAAPPASPARPDFQSGRPSPAAAAAAAPTGGADALPSETVARRASAIELDRKAAIATQAQERSRQIFDRIAEAEDHHVVALVKEAAAPKRDGIPAEVRQAYAETEAAKPAAREDRGRAAA